MTALSLGVHLFKVSLGTVCNFDAKTLEDCSLPKPV